MKAIIEIYAKLIKSGKKTIDDVPEKDRTDVEAAFADLYKTNIVNETAEANNE